MWSLNYREPAGAAEYIYRDKSGGQVFGDFNYQLHQYSNDELIQGYCGERAESDGEQRHNFLFGLYLVRNLPPVEFGLYGIGFAITLFYAGIGNAMFLTQMVVHIPNKAAEDREPYAARICLIMMLFCLVTAFLLVVLVYAGGTFQSGYTNIIIWPSQLSLLQLPSWPRIFHSPLLYPAKGDPGSLGQYCSCALPRRFLYCSGYGTSGWEFGILSPALWPQ